MNFIYFLFTILSKIFKSVRFLAKA